MSGADEIQFSKKGRREITDFMAYEFLYDYLSGTLDEERRRSLETALDSNREKKGDLQRMRNALEYTDMLSNTMVAENLIQEIKLPSSYIDTLLRKLRVEKWHSGVKLGLEVIAVAIGVVLIALAMPWSKLVNSQISQKELITLARMERTNVASAIEDNIENQVAAIPDEEEKPAAAVAIAPEEEAPVASAVQKVVVTAPVNKPAATAVAPTEAPSAAREGFIYRGTISIVNVSVSTAKIVETLAALGARKAGQVNLGRLKGNTSYFHMTVPESRFEDLKKTFNQYGELKISKEKHDRIMPEGIIRIIIDVTEKQGSP